MENIIVNSALSLALESKLSLAPLDVNWDIATTDNMKVVYSSVSGSECESDRWYLSILEHGICTGIYRSTDFNVTVKEMVDIATSRLQTAMDIASMPFDERVRYIIDNGSDYGTLFVDGQYAFSIQMVYEKVSCSVYAGGNSHFVNHLTTAEEVFEFIDTTLVEFNTPLQKTYICCECGREVSTVGMKGFMGEQTCTVCDLESIPF